LDPNANTGPVTPEPTPPPSDGRAAAKPSGSAHHDIAEPGPIDPATGQPDHGVEVSELKSWFRENAVSLVITAVVIAAVCIWLDPIDTLKVVIGLGFIIFIHELGHFLAAKWCDVHVRTFSIGFGPAVPFCSYKWGETTYMVGIIPLGGYVAMVGEGEGAEGEEEGEEDPRSFRKKSVWQRMLIISAGVVMNVLLGMACFVAAYLHGVPEKPATVGYIEGGGAAWRTGMRTGDHIVKIGDRDNPFFDDIRPKVMSSSKGEEIELEWDRTDPQGNVRHSKETIVPIRDEGQRFPQIGVAPPYQLTLISGNKQKVRPFFPGTPAAEATSADGKQRFEPGDRIIKMSNPDDPERKLTEVKTYDDYHKRMVRLAAEPITFEVQRKGSSEVATIIVKPAYRHDLGVRMRMGEVAALRKGGSAEKAGVIAHADGPQPTEGDRIRAVLLPPDKDGKRLWYVAGPVDWTKKEFFDWAGVDPKELQKQVTVQPLDPLLLPRQLSDWAKDKTGKIPVDLIVTRTGHPTDETKHLTLEYDPSFRFDRENVYQPNSPLPVSGLGLAYWVQAVVDEVAPGGPAAQAKTIPGELPTGPWHWFKRLIGAEGRNVAPGGELNPLKPDDVITAVRFKARDDAGNLRAGEWKDDLKPNQWASVDSVYQSNSAEIDVRVRRNKEEIELTLKGTEAKEWPLDDRGLIFQLEVEVQQAADVGDAIRLGGLRTVRFIKTVYMNLYGYINGRISVKTLSGPLTIANVSYKLAGEDFWQFLLFLGMISVNLAVVNFLPIPVLDGGHMVFLILEKILGRPVPERVFAFAMYTGLFLILALMVFVLFLDAGRLFFGMF
jgi:regulator of sigma E protease